MGTSEKRTRRSRNKLGRGLSALVDTQGGLPVAGGILGSPTKTDPQSETGAAAGSFMNDGLKMDPEGRVFEVSLEDLYPNKYQPRTTFENDSLESLASSIRESGLMQPIVVRARAAGGFEIIAGERRWRASRLAGLESIPAILRDVDDKQSAQWALIENIQREDLNPIEKAEGYKILSEQFGLTQMEISTRLGVGRVSIANTVRLLDLDQEIQGMIVDGRLSAGHGKAILQCPDHAYRRTLAQQAVAGGWSVRKLENEASASSGQGKFPTPAPGGVPDGRVESVISDLGHQLGEYLGTKVGLKTNRAGTKGRIQIEFYDLDHFDGLMSQIGFTAEES